MSWSSIYPLSLKFPRSCSNFNIHFNIILQPMPRSSKCSLPSSFQAPVVILMFILILSSHLCLGLPYVHFPSSFHAPVVILIFILILSSHLCLGLPSVIFPSSFHAPVIILILILILSSHLCLGLPSVSFPQVSTLAVILIFILILSSHLCLGLPSVIFPSGFHAPVVSLMFILILSSHLCLVLPSDSFPQVSSPCCVCTCPLPRVFSHAPLSHSSWSAHPNNFRSGVKTMKLNLRSPIILHSNSVNKRSAIHATSAAVTAGFPPPLPPHVLCGLRGPPSWAWQECNRLLRLGRPWGAVTLSRWCVSGDTGGCSARRGLKSKVY